MTDWIDSLERDIEVTEGQIALAALVSQSTVYIHVEVERLKRLVEAAKKTVNNRNLHAE